MLEHQIPFCASGNSWSSCSQAATLPAPPVRAPQLERTRRAAGIALLAARPAARCPWARRCWCVRAGHLSTRSHGWNERGDSLVTQNAALCGAGLETAVLKSAVRFARRKCLVGLHMVKTPGLCPGLSSITASSAETRALDGRTEMFQAQDLFSFKPGYKTCC